MDHETCSARLSPFARGELGDQDRRAVEDHLAGCIDCARELVAVRALMAVPDAEMTSDERRVLHRVVLSPRPSRWARLAPALGAVGLLVVVAIGVTSFMQDTDDSGPTAIQDEQRGSDTELSQEEAEAGTAVAPGRAANKTISGPATADSTMDAATGAGSTEAFSADTLEVATTFSAAPLGPHLLAPDEAALSTANLNRLRRDAPDRRSAAQMTECAELVQGLYPSPVRPAFASVYPTDRLLVMGFIFESGAERRYAFWGWHLGDCTRPTPIYVTGVLQ